jgi:hypothetical protein
VIKNYSEILSNDGLSWATAKKTLGFLYSQDVNALPRQIEATVNIYINGTVLAPDTTRHTIIDYFYGSGLLNITGLPTIISVNNISAYDNSLTSKEGKVFINSTGSGWTVDEQKYKFVDFNYSYGTMPNDYYPIINNSADKLNIWYADKTITPTMNYSIVSMPQIKGATVDNPGSIINFDNYKYFDFVGNNLLMDIRNLDLTNAHSGDKPDMIYNNNEIQINNIVANGLLTNFNNWIETDHCLFDVGSSWVSIEESISRMKDTIILSDGSGYGVYINGFSTNFMVYRVRFSNNVQCINNGGSGTINFFLNNYFDKCDQGIIAPSAIINLGVFDIPTSNIRFVDSPIALELSGNKVLMGNNVNLISYNVGTEVKVDGKVNKTFDDLESQTPISNAKMGTFVNYMNSNTYIPYSNEEYDNSSSTLQAYTYQDAIDKLAEQQMWANDSNNNYIKTTYPQNVNFTGNLTLGDKITFRLGEIIDNIVDGWIKLTGNVNVEGNMNVSGYVVSEYIQIQANSTEMICNATYLGSIYYDVTLNNHYGCNGSGWNAFY